MHETLYTLAGGDPRQYIQVGNCTAVLLQYRLQYMARSYEGRCARGWLRVHVFLLHTSIGTIPCF